MNQNDINKYQEMNLQTDALFTNQADRTDYYETHVDNHHVEMVTTNTRGVGKNRNIGLLFAKGDVLLIADDDMTYVDGYEGIVKNAFEELDDADAIIFNIDTIGSKKERRINNKISRVHYINAFNYGAVRIAVRRNSLLREGVTFNENFGGGTLYSAGEDSLFICEMLRHKFRIYTYPKSIATVQQFESTWFQGYNQKYFFDKGALFYALSHRYSKLLCVQDYLRHRNLYRVSELNAKQILDLEIKGAKCYVKLEPYSVENK